MYLGQLQGNLSMLNTSAIVTAERIWILSSISLGPGLDMPDNWPPSLTLFHKKIKNESVPRYLLQITD